MLVKIKGACPKCGCAWEECECERTGMRMTQLLVQIANLRYYYERMTRKDG